MHRAKLVLRPSLYLFPVRQRRRPRRCSRRLRSSSEEETSMPYSYEQQELQELLDLMPPPLVAKSVPHEDIKFKRLLDKYGLKTDALYGQDFEDRVKEQERRMKESADLESAPWLRDPSWDDSASEKEATEQAEDTEDEESRARAKFALECQKEYEYEQIFHKAMELHHCQRARSRNIYAACLWYSRHLKEADTEDHFSGHPESPIPSFIRAFFTLEEEFDELNAKQYEVELKKQKRAREIQDSEYKEFLRTRIINMPTRPGSELAALFESIKKEKPKELKQPENIDHLLYGILPHVDEDIYFEESDPNAEEIDLGEVIFKDVL